MRKINVQVGSVLIALVVSSCLSVSMAGAAVFQVHTNTNIFGLDIDSRDISPQSEAFEQAECQTICDGSPSCMAFTWVRRGVQGAYAKCWLKASNRIFDNYGLGLMNFDTNTVTGVKIYQSRACWARHWFNFKICDVVSMGSSRDASSIPPCPAGSVPAYVENRTQAGARDWYCVARRFNDPGNLPNCTDAYGGLVHEAGVLGNHVNHTCLDAN